jgi:solute carrier family 32 (vesicular inhibitory amino acid transporter)
VVGDIVGGGVIALPTAIVQAGIIPGLIFVIIMTAVCIYTSYLLGECWVILQKRWSEYKSHCRKPFPEIGRRALGSRIG